MTEHEWSNLFAFMVFVFIVYFNVRELFHRELPSGKKHANIKRKHF